MRALLLLVILLTLAPMGAALAQTPPPGRAASLGALFGGAGSSVGAATDKGARAARDPEMAELARRFAVLTGRPDAQLVRFAVERGQRALGAASIALADEQPKAARRAKQIAWAALDLAARVLARHAAETAERAAQRRAVAAETARDAQRQALVLLQQRLVETRMERP